MTKNRWVLAAVVTLVLVGGTTTVRADETDAATAPAARPVAAPATRPAATTAAEHEERAVKARQEAQRKQREESERASARGRTNLLGLAILVFVPLGMSIFRWSKRSARRVTLPLSQAERLRRACVVTGETDDLEKAEAKYKHTSSLGTAVGLISLISVFTGGIIYTPGSRGLTLKLAVSEEGRRLAAEGKWLIALSHLSRVLLWVAFFAAAISLDVQLLWIFPLVAALTVPALIAEKAATRSMPRCLGMTDDSISLEFGQASVAESIRAGVARAAARVARA